MLVTHTHCSPGHTHCSVGHTHTHTHTLSCWVLLLCQVMPGWSRPVIKVADFVLSKHDATLTFTRVVRHTNGPHLRETQQLSTMCGHMQ